MELMEGLLTRRSVRKFADKPVAKQDIIDIIKAAQHAPSAHNTQPWSFWLLRTKKFSSSFGMFSVRRLLPRTRRW